VETVFSGQLRSPTALGIAGFAGEALVGLMKPSLHGRAGIFVLGEAD
jgi:hypothetical protein